MDYNVGLVCINDRLRLKNHNQVVQMVLKIQYETTKKK